MNEVQLLVDVLAQRLQRPVGVDDRKFRAIAYSSHPTEIDPVRRDSILGRQAPVAVTRWLEDLGVLSAECFLRIPANPDLHMVARICCPLRFHSRLLGFLWLVEDDKPFSAKALAMCERFAADVAEELYRLQQQEGEERQREASQVDRLLSGSRDSPSPLNGLAARSRYGVLVLGVRGPVEGPHPPGLDVRLTEAVDRGRRSVQPHCQLASVVADKAVVVVAAASDQEVEDHARGLLAAASRELADFHESEPIVGLGGSVASLNDLVGAHEQAELALRLGSALPALGPFVRWDQLGPLGLVGQLLGEREATKLLPAPIRRLLAAADGEVLLCTLEAYLEHAGDAAGTARQLFLHRSSLYKRLHRIERLADVDLRSGTDRLQLHIGLALWRIAGGVDAT